MERDAWPIHASKHSREHKRLHAHTPGWFPRKDREAGYWLVSFKQKQDVKIDLLDSGKQLGPGELLKVAPRGAFFDSREKKKLKKCKFWGPVSGPIWDQKRVPVFQILL